MKSHLLIFALMSLQLNGTEPVLPVDPWRTDTRGITFPERAWKADTPGLAWLPGASYDNATHTIEVTASDKAVIPLLVDARPNIGMSSYLLMGEVKYEKVGGTGFLETWTTVGAGKAFSRTLAENGPMAKLTGSSAWREFVLPMNMAGASDPVKQIEMNVVLPDGGKVWVRNLRLKPMNFGSSGNEWGVTAAILLITLVAVLFIWRSRRRRSSESEIKRMMAADV